jgi:hypothetical protein
MEVVNVVEEKKESKYSKQIEYDKQRKANDPEYKAKKYAQVNARNKLRYQTDPEYRARVNAYQNERNKKLNAFYREHKNDFKDKIE